METKFEVAVYLLFNGLYMCISSSYAGFMMQTVSEIVDEKY